MKAKKIDYRGLIERVPFAAIQEDIADCHLAPCKNLYDHLKSLTDHPEHWVWTRWLGDTFTEDFVEDIEGGNRRAVEYPDSPEKTVDLSNDVELLIAFLQYAYIMYGSTPADVNYHFECERLMEEAEEMVNWDSFTEEDVKPKLLLDQILEEYRDCDTEEMFKDPRYEQASFEFDVAYVGQELSQLDNRYPWANISRYHELHVEYHVMHSLFLESVGEPQNQVPYLKTLFTDYQAHWLFDNASKVILFVKAHPSQQEAVQQFMGVCSGDTTISFHADETNTQIELLVMGFHGSWAEFNPLQASETQTKISQEIDRS